MKSIVIPMLICVIGIACSDFLEEKSQDEVLVSSTQDYSELILCYMPTDDSYEMLYALDDDIQIDESKLSSSRDNITALQYRACFTWQPDMWEQSNRLPDGYQATYSWIMGMNAILDGIDDVEGSEEEKDQVKAEALGLRGFYYLMLVNLYANPYNMDKEALGVPLKLSAALTENGIKRSSVKEVYEQIVSDFKESSSLFEKWPKRRGNYRINVTVVNIWLSRAYLYMEQWQDAINAATKALETAEGLTDFTKISTADFEMASYEWSEVEWLYGDNSIPSDLIPSEELISSYTANDVRPALWFDVYVGIKKNYVSDYVPTNAIRISEAYLNRAEAYAMLGKNEEALNDINELRRNRIVGYQDMQNGDCENLLNEIRVERRLELCFDGHRWFDLRRYGMPMITHYFKTKSTDQWEIYTLKEKDPVYTLPIPVLMLENNTALQQNPSANESERTAVYEETF